MKITFLSPEPNLSGGERVVAIYAKQLIERGHDVEVICAQPLRTGTIDNCKRLLRGGGWTKPNTGGPSHYAAYGVPHRSVNHQGPIRPGDLPDADAVVATFWSTAGAVADAPASKGRKVYLVQHDEGGVHPDEPAAEATYALPMTHVYVSSWVAQRIAERHPGAAGVTIPNAVEVDRFDRGARQRPARPTVGLMWSTTGFKASGVALAAVEKARQALTELDVVAFGSRQPDERAAAMIDRFVQRPEPDEMAALYGSCTAWLFSSRFEGFGLPILEAMAARTPVIGTRTGAAEDVITPDNGRLVAIDDTDAMAEAIIELAGMTDERWGAMSESAFAAASSWTWASATDRLESVLAGADVTATISPTPPPAATPAAPRDTAAPSNLDAPVVIVGALRAGTTLLTLLMGHHPSIRTLGEFEESVDGLPKSGWLTVPQYLDHLRQHRRFIGSGDRLPEGATSYVDAVRDVLAQRASGANEPAIGFCVHSQPERVPDLWPNARYVHLQRDPRDVARSCIGMGWAGNVYHGSDYWLKTERRIAALRDRVDANRFHTLSFERLVRDPTGTLSDLCAFLGLPYEPAMLAIDADTTYARPDAKLASQWQHRLTDRQVELVELRCGPLMREQGYKPVHDDPRPPSAIERVGIDLGNRLDKFNFRRRRYGLGLTVAWAAVKRLPAASWPRRRARLAIVRIDGAHLK